MVLNKLKDIRKSERGFTIVELLIVIVVIGILAGITIVAYSGITAKANSTKALTNAVAVQKVAEAFNADNGFYPALAASGTNSLGAYNGSTKVPTGVTILKDASTPAITASNGLTSVAYACFSTCTNSTGGYIAYWNFSTAAVNYIYVGAGTGTLTTPTASGYAYPAT